MAATEGVIFRCHMSWAGVWNMAAVGSSRPGPSLTLHTIPYTSQSANGMTLGLALDAWNGTNLSIICGGITRTFAPGAAEVTIEIRRGMNYSSRGGAAYVRFCDDRLYIDGADWGATTSPNGQPAWPAASVRWAARLRPPCQTYNIGLNVEIGAADGSLGLVSGWENDWTDASDPATWNNAVYGTSQVQFATRTAFGWTNLRTVTPGYPPLNHGGSVHIISPTVALRPAVTTGHVQMSAGRRAIVRRDVRGYATGGVLGINLTYDDWTNWTCQRVIERCADGEIPSERTILAMGSDNVYMHPRGYTVVEDNGRLILPDVDSDDAQGSTDQGAAWSTWPSFIDPDWGPHTGYGLPWRRTAGAGWIGTQWQEGEGKGISAAHVRPGYLTLAAEDESGVNAWGVVIPNPRAGVRPMIPYAFELRDGRFEIGAFHNGFQTAYRNGDRLTSNDWTLVRHTALAEHQISSLDWFGSPSGQQACVCYLPTTERIGVATRGGPDEAWACWTEVVGSIDRCCWPIIWQGSDGRWWVYVYREGAWERYVAGNPAGTWSPV